MSSGNRADLHVEWSVRGHKVCIQSSAGGVVWDKAWQEFRHIAGEKQDWQNATGGGGNAAVKLGLVKGQYPVSTGEHEQDEGSVARGCCRNRRSVCVSEK